MRKFKHYTFQAIMMAFGTSVAGAIVYTMILAFQNL